VLGWFRILNDWLLQIYILLLAVSLTLRESELHCILTFCSGKTQDDFSIWFISFSPYLIYMHLNIATFTWKPRWIARVYCYSPECELKNMLEPGARDISELGKTMFCGSAGPANSGQIRKVSGQPTISQTYSHFADAQSWFRSLIITDLTGKHD